MNLKTLDTLKPCLRMSRREGNQYLAQLDDMQDLFNLATGIVARTEL